MIVSKPFDYEGHVVKSRHGYAEYRVICRDPYNRFVMQSTRSRDRFMALDRKSLDENWEVVA